MFTEKETRILLEKTGRMGMQPLNY